MSSMSWIKIASLVAIATVGGVAWILIPTPAWTSAAIGTVVLLAVLVGAIFWFPLGNNTSKGSDAATLASIGPISVVLGILIPWASAAVLVALTGRSTTAWAMSVFTVGGFVMSFALLKASLSVVDQIGGASTGPSKRTLWITQLENLDLSGKDDSIKSQICAVVERLRYGASDIPDRVSEESPAIEQGIESLMLALHEGHEEDALKRIRALDVLVVNRDAGLRAARSKV